MDISKLRGHSAIIYAKGKLDGQRHTDALVAAAFCAGIVVGYLARLLLTLV